MVGRRYGGDASGGKWRWRIICGGSLAHLLGLFEYDGRVLSITSDGLDPVIGMWLIYIFWKSDHRLSR